MGQTMSEPVTVKATACCENSNFKVGSSCMQRWRVNMEDFHTHILSMPNDPNTAFFGVFDGHGGGKIAEYVGKHLHKYVTNQREYSEGNIPEAMRKGFLEIDDAMALEESLTRERSGTTAITVIVKNNQIYCANVGDSRAVASIGGKAVPLSNDHKPNKKEEHDRITAAGGWVEYDRVNGNLALSRALGDYIYKKNPNKKAEEQIVSALPDVTEYTMNEDWEFIVLACDGIWDVMGNQEVVDYIREEIAEGLEPEKICENIMMRCLAPDLQMAGLGCDNMTVLIIGLLHNEPFEQLKIKCSGVTNNTECEGTNQVIETKEDIIDEPE
ncbi:probable protein phosphatase 2C T23F11.1 [Coccinella septempunctata]|uniref:probable protein phosphatase 2C T23F11.1 n=1 Tax=Coccinella septempunctata TaxID=41139 RepID=UPI001D06E7E7|nr:probable protein phosphatase 2C T23F11.1 [Coccinella septempunctata]